MDGNRPYGFYGELYDRATGAKSKVATKPHQETTQWEKEAISATLLLEEIKQKYENYQH